MATKNKQLSVYQLKVTLKGSKPPIWRELLVPSNLTLKHLHDVLQVAMGWDHRHLHHFGLGESYYGNTNPDFGLGDDVEDERNFTVSQLLTRERAAMIYEYDFGDGWEHKIELKKILPADEKAQQARCIKGARACPPEDCGGIWGYADLLDIIKNPEHPEREEMLDWLGDDFDPEYFDIDAVNGSLEKLFR